ncbi:hypothetical protein BC835DRAFT_316073 [Cytidiella melzeri]|nr:hypothetical protein BC835DRAFT_316073 [Cytidiella melzeri]
MTSPSLPVAGPSQHPKALALSPLQPYFPEPHSSLKRPSKRRTLPEAAKAILSNYYASVSENPNLDERKELLPQIISIPGAEWYTLVHIKKWFASRKCNRFGAKRHESRHRDEEEQSRVSISETDKILWPSLTASKIDKLAILLRETPKPSVTHLQVWGRSLDAQLSHLQNWVELNQAQSKHISTKHVLHPRHPESEHALKPHTIPTPESTASPEPPNSKPYSTSPSIGPTILYQQTYSNYGVPAHVGSSGTLPHHSQAFASPADAVSFFSGRTSTNRPSAN